MHRICLLIFFSLLSGAAIAQTGGKFPWEELGNRVEASQKVEALGPELFGDQVSLSNGSLSFAVTDVSLPGNNALPVQLTRRYEVRDWRHRVADGMLKDWDLAIPRISGVNLDTWLASDSSQSRCSVGGPPPSLQQGLHAADFWEGSTLDIPGVSSGELLLTDSSTTKPAADYRWMTNDQVHVKCLSSIKNGAGEGFLAVTPDGTKYWFDWMGRQDEPILIHKLPIYNPGGAQFYEDIIRRRHSLYVSRIEDRFGNWVNFTYGNTSTQPGRLTKIASSDGRQLTISYANGAISSVSDGTRTWSYTYGSTASGRGTLTGVTLPDSTSWSINFSSFTNAEIKLADYQPGGEINRTCTINEIPQNADATAVGTLTHPSGAVGTFTLAIKEHGRSRVPLNCRNVTTWVGYPNGTGNDPSDDIPIHTKSYYAWTLASKAISGPGVPTNVWYYDYASNSSFHRYSGVTLAYPVCTLGYTACMAPPCTSNSCAGRSTTTIRGPGGQWVRYRHGNTYRYDEGKLISVEVGAGDPSTAPLKTVTYAYDLSMADGAYKARWGRGQKSYGESFPSEYHRPMTRVDTHLQGQVFTWRVDTFDAFARPSIVYRQSDLPVAIQSLKEQTYYRDDLANWVIGQVLRRTMAGEEVEETEFTEQGLPWKLYVNTALVQTLAYNADGTIASVTDPLNNTTTLANWYRGLPRLVTFPDATTLSATVDSRGWVTSVTNEVGAKTSYAYDALGRITQVTYPTGDPVSWTPTTMSFVKATTSAFGLPAGHWKHTTNRGSFRKEVYYDALWRPVIQREWEVGNSTATLRYSGWAYDHANRVTFAGYPRSSASSLASFTAGTTTTYDALGRVTRVEQDSELGDLVTLTTYLAGLKTKVTNPRGYSTTTSYRAFDDLNAAQAYRIEAPGGVVTDITLDAFGKTTTLTRSGTYEGVPVSLSRHYVYDSRQRLCKRVEPETGASIFSYDAAGNLAWSAEGQPYTGTTACNITSVVASEKTLRSYDSRNRLVLVDYPDSTPDVTTTYTPDGKVATIGRAPTLLTYSYNKLGLLTHERLEYGNINWLTSHSYSTLGHLTATTYPSGHQVGYAPNALGQATQAGTYATGATYHPNGALAEFTYGNGIVHTLTQNLRQLPERSRDALGTNVVLDDSYDYDANGNVAAISDGLPNQPGNRDMTYDSLDRLVRVVAGTAQGGEGVFRYDPLDNLRRLDQGSREFRYYYDANNRLAEIRSPEPEDVLLHTFGYDARGNTTSKDSGTLTFDRENRLTASALPTATTYVYDGLGRRVREFMGASTYFYYSYEGKLLYNSDLKTSTRTDHIYLSGSLVATRKVPFGTNTTPEVTYQHTDALGTPVAFTDASGNVTRRERMTAWGEPADGTWTNGPGYTGHQMDAGSKLVYMQQRYYDPLIGRFMSIDPIVADARTGKNFGRFLYANNNPMGFRDPDGRQAQWVFPGGVGSNTHIPESEEEADYMSRAPARPYSAEVAANEWDAFADAAGDAELIFSASAAAPPAAFFGALETGAAARALTLDPNEKRAARLAESIAPGLLVKMARKIIPDEETSTVVRVIIDVADKADAGVDALRRAVDSKIRRRTEDAE